MTDPNFNPAGEGDMGVAQLTNMNLALRTMLDLQNAGKNSPRMGAFYGDSGFGKSVAAAFVAAQTDAAYVQARSVWTAKTFLTELAIELGISRPPRTAPLILEAITDQLAAYPRPIIIDEFDFLVKHQTVEIVRDIHEFVADIPEVGILLIGEEALPHKLKEWERFHNRILIFTPAEPASVEDARKLRDLYCRKIDIADDLVEHIRTANRGVTRRIRVSLAQVQRTAIDEGMDSVDLAKWGNRHIATGEAPRRMVRA